MAIATLPLSRKGLRLWWFRRQNPEGAWAIRTRPLPEADLRNAHGSTGASLALASNLPGWEWGDRPSSKLKPWSNLLGSSGSDLHLWSKKVKVPSSEVKVSDSKLGVSSKKLEASGLKVEGW